MTEFGEWLGTYGEAGQYLAFFGALAAFGAIEAFWPRAHAPRTGRWPANAGLTLLNVVVIGALPLGGLAAAVWSAEHGFGLLHATALDPALAFVMGVLLRTLVSWATHLAMHKVPLLWRIHRVHHSDEAIDVTTTVRFHPLEFVVASPFSVLGIVAFGIPPAAVIAFDLGDAALTVFNHANMRLPGWLERALRLVVVTPELHRIHHSSRQVETDSNFGAHIPLWDWLFGTYRGQATDAPLGLDEWRGRETTSLPRLLVNPFQPAHGALAKSRTEQEIAA